ncbi:MAG: MFS transporter [Melioribacteraceae bacterium]|nr:MFS transporter [Melioribacteraceae bacterium]
MDKEFQSSSIVTISAAHLIHDVFSSFLAPLLPMLIPKLNISYSMAGILTIFQRIPALMNPLLGMLADKLPVRYLLIAAPAITAISMSLLGSASSYLFVALLLLVAGVGSSLFHVPAPVMIKKIAGERVGKGMSFFMFGGEVARSIGPLLVLAAVSFWSLEETYKLIPVGIISSVILYIRFKNIPISESFRRKTDIQEKAGPLVKKLMPTFIQLALVIFFLSLVKASLTTFLPTYITDSREGSVWAGGISLSILQLAGAAGTFASGTISDKIGRKKVLVYMSIAVPVLMFFYIISGTVLAIVFLLLMGFFMFASTPVLLAIINVIDSEHPVLVNGIFMTVNFIFGALAVAVIGLLGDIITLELTYYISPLLGLAAIPFIYKLPGE